MFLWILAAIISVACSTQGQEDVIGCRPGYQADDAYKKCYKFFDKPDTWMEARYACEQDKTRLAIPQTLDEARYIGEILNSLRLEDSQYAFVNFYNLKLSKADDFWRNTFGIPLDGSLIWAKQEPDMNTTSCLAMDTMGQMHDETCSTAHVFFCEHELGNPFFYRITELVKKLLMQ